MVIFAILSAICWIMASSLATPVLGNLLGRPPKGSLGPAYLSIQMECRGGRLCGSGGAASGVCDQEPNFPRRIEVAVAHL
jgi:hypothetical protein